MKEKINFTDYAQKIIDALGNGGVLLGTNGDKYNAMVIGWGCPGRVWNRPTFSVFVRQNRYTKGQIDKTGEFTISAPLAGADAQITKVCGSMSGHDIDKVKEAALTLEEPEVTNTPGVREYPLTLECRVLYSQKQDITALPQDIQEKLYPQDVDGSYPMANRDAHTEYIGEVVAAYIIR
ncbi:MAG: flavin reductase [Lachnospiraceae bacterium]|nr:flavin reductase [Lachnospiraceae bacterium]